jgi:hypothetical protein
MGLPYRKMLIDWPIDFEFMNISTKDVTAWFREKAKEFNAMADSLESTFNSANGSVKSPKGPHGMMTDVTLEQVKSAVGKKAARAKEIATVLNTTRKRVRAIVDTNPNEFELIGRGWIKNKK